MIPPPRYMARPESPAGLTWEVVAKEKHHLLEVVATGLIESAAIEIARQLNEANNREIVSREYQVPEDEVEPLRPIEEEGER